MNNQEERMSAGTPARAGDETLPDLIGRLGQDLATLVDTKITLLKVEVKEDISAYSRSAMMMGVGSVIATVGFALLNVAVAFFISTLFENTELSQPAKYALGFIITALLYLLIGGFIIVIAKNRMASQTPVPDRSLKELEKDKQWLEKEL
jgi:uncharacterized membrane protein YqjE